MKKLLTIVMFMAITIQVFADAYYVKRKRCVGNLQWKYISYACVNLNFGAPAYGEGSGTQKACTINTQVDKYGKTCPCIGFTPIPVATRAEAHAGVGPSLNGYAWTYTQPGYTSQFSTGLDKNKIYESFAVIPMYRNENLSNPDLLGTRAKISDNNVVFDTRNHQIIINGINAELLVDDPDMANTYASFKIFILDTRGSDEDLKGAKVIKSMEAFIYNGELLLIGDLTTKDFTKISNKAQYLFSNINKTISIDPSIDMDYLAVKFGTDIGNLENGINTDFQFDLRSSTYKDIEDNIIVNSKFNLEILQNPAIDILNFEVSNGINKYNSITINLAAIDGRILKTIYSGDMIFNNKIFVENISQFDRGIYLLTIITDNGDTFSRKFIKE